MQAPGDTQRYNRFAYVRNNPLTLTDPSGYSWIGKWAKKKQELFDPIGARLHERTSEVWLKNSEALRGIVGVVMGILDFYGCLYCSIGYNSFISELMGGSASQTVAAGAFLLLRNLCLAG